MRRKPKRWVVSVHSGKTVETSTPLFVDGKGAFCATAVPLTPKRAQTIAAEVRGALLQLGVHETAIVHVHAQEYWGIYPE